MDAIHEIGAVARHTQCLSRPEEGRGCLKFVIAIVLPYLDPAYKKYNIKLAIVLEKE